MIHAALSVTEDDMRAVIQRVGRTVLSVDGQLISAIKSGLAVYLGIGPEDEKKKCGKHGEKNRAAPHF